jgi:Pyridoxamine 5'-phosphate oxidase
VTATLPAAVQEAFQRFLTTELTTIDSHGQPITWPVTPFYRPGDTHISVTTGLGYPKKAHDARRNPKVALLFSDATGSAIRRPSMVLVQGIAEVDDRDLDANRERYERDLAEKLGGSRETPPSGPLARRFDWYFTRIYVHVRPERVYVWRGGDCGLDPELLDSHMEEVRSGRVEEPEQPAARPAGGAPIWDRRIDDMRRRYDSAVLSFVAPDGFPFSIRVPVGVNRRGRAISIDADPVGAPLRPGLACVTAHDHDERLRWTRNFQVRGDLVHTAPGDWVVVPQRVVGGFELPPASAFTRAVSNYAKIRRFRKTAKRERAKRGERASGP